MPVQVSIKVVNGKLVSQGLEKIRRSIPLIGKSRIFKMMQKAKDTATTYPAQLPGQKYVRTGTYGRAFKIVKNPSSTAKTPGYTLRGSASQKGFDYTKLVGGDSQAQGQASIHQGRWPLVREVVEDAVAGLPKALEGDIALSVKRNLK